MILINLLHFYQPINQQDDILERIVGESYRPILQGLIARPKAKLNINISGVLTKLLHKKGFDDILNLFKELSFRNQIEFTSSAMYHPILPLLPYDECLRQIELNDLENRKIFGDLYNPKGFFPPEMAVNDDIFKLCASRSYEWIAAPTVSLKDTSFLNEKRFYYKNSDLLVLFRNKIVSSLILSAQVRNAQDLLNETKDFLKTDKYWFTVMDGETFGHHRIGHEKVLFDILDSKDIQSAFGSDIKNMTDLSTERITPNTGTWTNSEQDFFLNKKTRPSVFVLWKDSKNPIHKYQWGLTYSVIDKVDAYTNKKSKNWLNARKKLDEAIASDQYWWASGDPWWSLEMIEAGAYALLAVLKTLFKDDPSSDAKNSITNASELYNSIVGKAFEWQRSGYIRKKHIMVSSTKNLPPLQDRTPSEWFNQLILEFEYEMNRAVANQDFEKAIKWRDAIIKVSLGTDMYDILHVVDELWLGRNMPWAKPVVKPFLEHTWDEFSEFAKHHFLAVSDRYDFDLWKKTGLPPQVHTKN